MWMFAAIRKSEFGFMPDGVVSPFIFTQEIQQTYRPRAGFAREPCSECVVYISEGEDRPYPGPWVQFPQHKRDEVTYLWCRDANIVFFTFTSRPTYFLTLNRVCALFLITPLFSRSNQRRPEADVSHTNLIPQFSWTFLMAHSKAKIKPIAIKHLIVWTHFINSTILIGRPVLSSMTSVLPESPASSTSILVNSWRTLLHCCMYSSIWLMENVKAFVRYPGACHRKIPLSIAIIMNYVKELWHDNEYQFQCLLPTWKLCNLIMYLLYEIVNIENRDITVEHQCLPHYSLLVWWERCQRAPGIAFFWSVQWCVVTSRIWGSHGGEYEDGCLLGCSAV
jgi:hypothetical protein